jgi:hypothetical protein
MNPMMKELSQSEPVCERYGPLKIIDGFIQTLDKKIKENF